MDRPMLFSAPMVRAILDGTKTQTRRIVKPQPAFDALREHFTWDNGRVSTSWSGGRPQAAALLGLRGNSPYGIPGDRLWVRETFGVLTGAGHRYVYRADGDEPKQAFYPDETIPDMRWTPSIHMPRRASRITLEVTEVRVERLNAITQADARAEGVADFDVWGDLTDTDRAGPRGAFEALWNSINGPTSWDANPWVWVISFKRAESAKEAANG